jgi:formylglycine-generating enzyme required for sulfatase activity
MAVSGRNRYPQPFGEYVLIGRLGQGGMGTVHRAEQPRLNRQVALKMCRSDSDEGPPAALVARFRREVRAAGGLDHPNLCPVYDHGVIDGELFFTMPCYEGTTLKRWLAELITLDQRQAARLVAKVARAMQYAHDRGVVHRDLKPSNIMLAGGEPVVLDFGMADVAACTQFTRTGELLGTPAYMAPEQAESGNAAGPFSDVYSLGAILYELLTRELPFTGANHWVVLLNVRDKDPKPPRELRADIDEELERVCLKAMAKKPEDRHPSMAAFAEALEAFYLRDGDASVALVETHFWPPRPSGTPVPVQPWPPQPSESAPSPGGRGAGVQYGVPLATDLELRFAWCPPGVFRMGSPDDERGRFDDEGPQHRVTLTKGFWLGITQVTQAQWRAVMGSNPSNWKGLNLPVEGVTWDDCQSFCQRLGRLTSKKYRLPTEAEWEYAARAATTTAYHFGEDDRRLGEYAWFRDNSGRRTHPVAEKLPNAWGLYDTAGNVWEWCEDWFGAYPEDAVQDPTGDTNGLSRVLRGGSWRYGGARCRAAYRLRLEPDRRRNAVGCRIVLCQE